MGKFSGDNMLEENDYFVDSVSNIGTLSWESILELGRSKLPAGTRRSSAADVVARPPGAPRRTLIQDDEE